MRQESIEFTAYRPEYKVVIFIQKFQEEMSALRSCTRSVVLGKTLYYKLPVKMLLYVEIMLFKSTWYKLQNCKRKVIEVY